MRVTNYNNRRVFKGDFFEAVLYGDNTKHYSTRSPITKEFERRFPAVWAFILETKKNGYEQLARDMQTAESRFMIGRVCGRLAQHHSYARILTIHDSIMVAPHHMPLVRRVIQEEFARMGLSPSYSDSTDPVCTAA